MLQASRESACINRADRVFSSPIVRPLDQVNSIPTSLVGFDGFDVRKIDDIEYTVEISCYFLTKWHEDRLVLHEDIAGEQFDEDGNELEEQWFPIDLEFVTKV